MAPIAAAGRSMSRNATARRAALRATGASRSDRNTGTRCAPSTGQREDEADAGPRHRRLEQRVGDERPAGAAAVPGGERVAEREPRHEARQDDAGGPHAVAEREAGLAEPERLEHEGGGPREEDGGGEKGHPGYSRSRKRRSIPP